MDPHTLTPVFLNFQEENPRNYRIEVLMSDCIAQLKRKLHELVSAPINSIHIFFNEVPLEDDDRKVSSYNIPPDSILKYKIDDGFNADIFNAGQQDQETFAAGEISSQVPDTDCGKAKLKKRRSSDQNILFGQTSAHTSGATSRKDVQTSESQDSDSDSTSTSAASAGALIPRNLSPSAAAKPDVFAAGIPRKTRTMRYAVDDVSSSDASQFDSDYTPTNSR